MASKNNQNFIAFCNELREYVEEHHLYENKDTQNKRILITVMVV